MIKQQKASELEAFECSGQAGAEGLRPLGEVVGGQGFGLLAPDQWRPGGCS